jgi:hypothetical protein
MGWGGHQGNLMAEIRYEGDGLGEDGMPQHGTLYCVRGIDKTTDKPAIYLVGITGNKRKDGTENSFSEKGFLSPHEYAKAIFGERGF